MNRTPPDPSDMSQDAILHKCLGGMRPFTITFRTPEETRFLFNATMEGLFPGRSSWATDLLNKYVEYYGHDGDPVKHWAEDARKNGIDVPDWFVPLMQHVINEVKRKHNKL